MNSVINPYEFKILFTLISTRTANCCQVCSFLLSVLIIFVITLVFKVLLIWSVYTCINHIIPMVGATGCSVIIKLDEIKGFQMPTLKFIMVQI